MFIGDRIGIPASHSLTLAQRLQSIGDMTFFKDYRTANSLNADFAAGSNTATFTSARTATNPAALVETQAGNALLFDGVNDSVSISGVNSYFSANADFTVIVKFKASDISSSHTIFSSAISSSNKFSIRLSGDEIRTAYYTTSYTAKSTAFTQSDDWHTVVVVNTSGVITAYLNGAEMAGTNNPFMGDTAGTVIGERTDNTQYFSGQTKELAFWDVAKSGSDLDSINSGTIVTSNLVSHYDFSDGSGSTLTDIVGGNNGTITGAKWLTNGSKYLSKVTADDSYRITEGYYDDTGYHNQKGLMVEAAGTNLLIHSIFDDDTAGLATGWLQADDVTNAATTSMVSEDFTNISGSRAQRIQQTFGDGTYTYLVAANPTSVGSFSPDDYGTFSVWLKGTVTGISNLYIQIIQRDAAGTGGTVSMSADIKSSLSSTEWRRFVFSEQLTDADLSRVSPRIIVVHPGSGSIDLQIACAQVEVNPYATSFIPTTSAALSRTADVLKYAISGNRTAATETDIIKFALGSDAGTGGNRIFTSTDTKTRIIYKISGFNITRGFVNQTDNDTAFTVLGLVPTANDSHVLTYTFKHTSPYITSYYDGDNAVNYTTADWTTNAWGTYFYLGNNGANQLDGIIQSAVFYSDTLDSTAVGKATDILNQ